MRARCYKPSTKSYRYYGGRGISVCDEWLNDFEQFYLDMGDKPPSDGSRKDEWQLDRIDNNGNYEKANCKWSKRSEQMTHRSVSYYITYNGITQCLTSWANQLNISRSSLNYRLKHNLTFAQAVAIGASRNPRVNIG